MATGGQETLSRQHRTAEMAASEVIRTPVFMTSVKEHVARTRKETEDLRRIRTKYCQEAVAEALLNAGTSMTDKEAMKIAGKYISRDNFQWNVNGPDPQSKAEMKAVKETHKQVPLKIVTLAFPVEKNDRTFHDDVIAGQMHNQNYIDMYGKEMDNNAYYLHVLSYAKLCCSFHKVYSECDLQSHNKKHEEQVAAYDSDRERKLQVCKTCKGARTCDTCKTQIYWDLHCQHTEPCPQSAQQAETFHPKDAQLQPSDIDPRNSNVQSSSSLGSGSCAERAVMTELHYFLHHICKNTDRAEIVFKGHGIECVPETQTSSRLWVHIDEGVLLDNIIDDITTCFIRTPPGQPPRQVDLVFAQCYGHDHNRQGVMSLLKTGRKQITVRALTTEDFPKTIDFYQPGSKEDSYHYELMKYAKKKLKEAEDASQLTNTEGEEMDTDSSNQQPPSTWVVDEQQAEEMEVDSLTHL